MPAAVVLPVRSFSTGKARLAVALDETARADLGRRLASRVRWAAGSLACYVVTADADVRAWADDTNAIVVADTGGGLDEAARLGAAAALAGGATHVIVAHADLPRARDLAWTAEFDGVTIVGDRHGDGTNVLAFPADVPMTFAYGPGSRAKHEAIASALGVGVRVVDDPELGWDIDEPADLEALGPGLALPDLHAENPCEY